MNKRRVDCKIIRACIRQNILQLYDLLGTNLAESDRKNLLSPLANAEVLRLMLLQSILW